MIKLHLGCGSRYIEGFIHIDLIDNYDHINHITSVDNLTMYPDNSVDLIYCSHVLEHFKRSHVPAVLKEWYRVLKPAGLLRLSVPDFEKLIEVYLKYEDLKLIIGPLYGRQDHELNIHYTTFDYPSLCVLLQEAGFKNVRWYNWKETEHSHIDDYSQAYIPHMDKENGILISLNLEAIK